MTVNFEYAKTNDAKYPNWSFFKMIDDTDPVEILRYSIYCITLKCRPERKECAKEIFETNNIPVNWAVAEKHFAGGEAGCFTSHLAVLNDAYAKGAQHVVVFEDDAIPARGFSNYLISENVVNFVKCADYDIFNWGPKAEINKFTTKDVTLYSSGDCSIRGIYNLHSYLTHAYIMSRDSISKIKNIEYVGMPIDNFYCEFKKSYSIYPMQFIQDPSQGTDVQSLTQIEKIFKFLGVLAYTRKLGWYFTEWYSININIRLVRVLIWAFVILLLIVLLAILAN